MDKLYNTDLVYDWNKRLVDGYKVSSRREIQFVLGVTLGYQKCDIRLYIVVIFRTRVVTGDFGDVTMGHRDSL